VGFFGGLLAAFLLLLLFFVVINGVANKMIRLMTCLMGAHFYLKNIFVFIVQSAWV